MLTHFRPVVVPLALAILAGGCTVRLDSEEQFAREEKRFTVKADARLRVSTFDGSIELRSWDRDEVLVEVEKRGPDDAALKAIQVRAEQKGNTVEVDVVRGARSESFVGIGVRISPSARLIVTVPRKIELHARTGDGSIRADRLEGTIELRTDDGAIRADELKGSLEFETRDGSIVAEDVDGQVTLTTRDGGILVSGRLAALRARTGDGSITVRAEQGSEVGAPWSVTTGDGSVAMYLPETFNADVDAQTEEGRVRSDFGLESREGGRRRSQSLFGKIGAGGNVVRIRSGDGTISLRNW